MRIILAVTNDLVGDQRLHRVCTTLHEAGHSVLLVGRELPQSVAVQREYATHRMRLRNLRGKLFYAEYNLRLLLFLLRTPADALTANDLDTLPAMYLAARLKGCCLFYDSHEYFTEVPELIHRPATRRVWLWIEQRLFPRLKTVYTVNQSLADIYAQLYGVAVTAIRNVPFRREAVTATPSDTRILLYQGALNVGRGIELMIEAMAHLPEKYTLWIIGRGDIEDALRKHCEAQGLAHRVRFYGFIPLHELPPLTAQAALGFSLEEDLGLNYRYASPNKVYDYIQSGIPVLISDLPEMRLTIETYKVGELLTAAERTPAQLAQRVQAICENPAVHRRYAEACHVAAEALCWERESQRLLELYAAQDEA